MENAKTSKFFNRETIERFKNIGGVRIESDLVMMWIHTITSKTLPNAKVYVHTTTMSNYVCDFSFVGRYCEWLQEHDECSKGDVGDRSCDGWSALASRHYRKQYYQVILTYGN